MNNLGAPNPKGRAISMASLRAVVAGYLIYLGGKLIYDRLHTESEMPVWLAWVFGIFFILVGGAFGFYTWKRYRKEVAEANAQEAEPYAEPAGVVEAKEEAGEAEKAAVPELPDIAEEPGEPAEPAEPEEPSEEEKKL